MAKRKEPEHVVMDGDTMRCKNCGRSYRPRLPIECRLFVDLLDSFVKHHRQCKPQTKESKCK